MAKLRIFALLLCLVALAFSQGVTEQEATIDLDEEEIPANDEASTDTKVKVENYLEQLSDEQLEKVCLDRGLALDGDPDSLTREDYIAAAQQCISLEEDINAILAENPDLAAELDKEVERMKVKKEKLEKERDERLEELAILEEQLGKAGVTVEASANTTKSSSLLKSSSTPASTSSGEPQTALEVFKESLVLLYQRVMQDVMFVRKILKPVLDPLGDGLKLVWRYAKPTINSVCANVLVKAKELKSIIMEKIAESRSAEKETASAKQ